MGRPEGRPFTESRPGSPQHLRRPAVNHRSTPNLRQPLCRAIYLAKPRNGLYSNFTSVERITSVSGLTSCRIDLNADVGEGFPDDGTLMGCITSASVACGGHAGSAALMRETVRLARGCGVAVGAHPGFPDREGFG